MMNETRPEAGTAGQANKRPNSVAVSRLVTVLITVILTFSLTAGGFLLWIQARGPDLSVQETDRLTFSFQPDPQTQAALGKLQSVYGFVQDRYYKALTDAELIEAMLRGLVNELDSPYTFYLTAEENEQIEESMSGQYSGIGAFVALNKDGLVEVTEVIEKSPAEEAQIMIGDVFVEVDGQDVTGFRDITAVAALVRGPEGTTVDLVLFRPSINDRVPITVARRAITSASVAHRMLEPGIGYVQVREFSQQVSKHFTAAVDELQAQGARHLVVDLRNNAGGMAHEVVDMLDYLLPQATLATVRGREKGQPYELSWTSDPRMGVSEDMRYAILVNSFSASASELFAGCLRDHGKAVLVGEQTFGKGSGTVTIPLDDGSAINLTNFLYILPKGDSLEGVGLAPDLPVSLPEDIRTLSLNRLTREQDTQLSAALDWLDQLP